MFIPDSVPSSIAGGWCLPSSDCSPPAYAFDLLGCGVTGSLRAPWRGAGQVIRAKHFSLISLLAGDCQDLGPDEFEQTVTDVYRTLGLAIAAERRHPVRIWNFVPGINDGVSPGIDRYMVFNAGRHAAYAAWSGHDVGAWVPAASGVGSGETLAIHCLAADSPGAPIENPRQRPAYRYSRRYGPRPPCFARATIVSHREAPVLLISGTASIVGEDSIEIGSLAGQLDVTFDNLRALWGTAHARDPQVAPLTDARVYLPAPSDPSLVLERVRAAMPTIGRVEVLRSALCRPELLVEIEAASLPLSSGQGDPAVAS